jgi:hypothetical protein
MLFIVKYSTCLLDFEVDFLYMQWYNPVFDSLNAKKLVVSSIPRIFSISKM